MINRDNCIEAIAKCTGYDPIHSPRHDSPQAELIARAWTDHFSQFPALTREDLLDGVSDYYLTPKREWPQPADISSLARARRRDRADRAALPAASPVSDDVRERHMDAIRDTLSKHWSINRESSG